MSDYEIIKDLMIMDISYDRYKIYIVPPESPTKYELRDPIDDIPEKILFDLFIKMLLNFESYELNKQCDIIFISLRYHSDYIREIVNRNINILFVNNNNDTLLHLSIIYNLISESKLKYLIQGGLKIDDLNLQNSTPLSLFCLLIDQISLSLEEKKSIIIMLSNEKTINAYNISNNTPLGCMCIKYKNNRIKENCSNASKEKYARLANENYSVIKTLLICGANKNNKIGTEEVITVLEYVLKNCDRKLQKLLINVGTP